MIKKISLSLFIGCCCLLVISVCIAKEEKDEKSKEEEQAQKMKDMESVTVTVISSNDESPQKAIFYAPPEAAPGKPGATFGSGPHFKDSFSD